ncbi:hypothetical protein [Methylobacter sp. YRD-M1]|uniref:hypothetical protein n=1 Tax=Methylobacter sp. YRD-M1 TaxID=2911520 RepID=UPI00227A0E04|nr:hypothetical protein [Methylobacter sp. YRD-M1]WAK02102.1 hypothetical protein LZ558_20180 [Methylobacter sp. YRD-M1]
MKIIDKTLLLPAFTALSMIEVSAVVPVDSAQQATLKPAVNRVKAFADKLPEHQRYIRALTFFIVAGVMSALTFVSRLIVRPDKTSIATAQQDYLIGEGVWV